MTAIFLSAIVTIRTLGSVGTGSVERVYDRGIPKAIVCDSPSMLAITGAVMAIESLTFCSTTGALAKLVLK